MRAFVAPLVLAFTLAGSLSAQAPKFIKVDIVGKSVMAKHLGENGPTEVHIRVPLNVAQGVLTMAAENGCKDVKVNGKHRDLKVDQVLKLLEGAKAGDLLLEITTDKGDLVKVAVE